MTTPTTLQTPGYDNLPEPLASLSRRDEDARILEWAQQQYKRIKNQRSSLERQWYLNLAFYFGKQNVQVLTTPTASGTGFSLHTPKAPPWRVRLIVNKIRPIIRTELAKVTSQRPIFTVVPATTEDQDRSSARVAEQIFESAYTNKSLEHIFRRAEWWNLICGTSFIKDYYDPVKPDETGQLGEICIEPVTPFHLMVPDLREEEIEHQPYLIHATTKSCEWVRQYYGINIQPNVKAAHEIMEDSFLQLVGANTANKDEVLCLEVWIKPGGHPNFPEGGLITIVGDMVVQTYRQYPYLHGQYPFSKLEHVPTGQFYADSVVTDLIPLQREYNRTRSQIIESKNRMAKPQLIAPRGSVNPAQITTEPGQVILYTPGFTPPQPLPLQSIPAYVLEELNRIQQDMDDISGQHEITRGQNPAQVTAATALTFLQEQDDTKLSHTVAALERAVAKLGRHYLSHVSQFWDTARLVRVVGMDGSFDAMQYRGSDIGGNHDVRVEAGSALPISKAAKQALVMDLLKMGFIPPEKGLEVLDIGGIEKVYADFQTDVRQAQRENLRMAAGMPVMPNDYDNHDVHIEVHNRFRKGQQFELLPDEIKAVFQMHVQMHQMAVLQQQDPMAMQATEQPQPSENAGGGEAVQASMAAPPQGGTA